MLRLDRQARAPDRDPGSDGGGGAAPSPTEGSAGKTKGPTKVCRSCGEAMPDVADLRFCPACGAAQLVPSGEPEIGTVVAGRYRLVHLLGEGGIGRVYEARQAVGQSERQVAVKILLSRHAARPTAARRILREVELASQLSHPSTVRVFDFGQIDDGRPFVVMEFVEGVPLSKPISEGPIPLERACRILSQVCGAVTEAHERDIIHRDLKPDNILLMDLGEQHDLVKVVDFGIAKQIGLGHGPVTPITERGALVGTPEYMSPEQFAGSDVGRSSDVYSLGVIAYEMLTGKLPFDADELYEWATRHTLDPPRPFEATEAGAGLPQQTKDAIFKALSKAPANRQASAADFYADLASGLESEAPPLGSVLPPPPRSRKASHPEPTRPDDSIQSRPAPTRDDESSRPLPTQDDWEARPAPPRQGPSPTIPLEQVPLTARAHTRTESMRPERSSRRWIWIALVTVLLAAGGGVLAWLRPWHRTRYVPPMPPPPSYDIPPKKLEPR